MDSGAVLAAPWLHIYRGDRVWQAALSRTLHREIYAGPLEEGLMVNAEGVHRLRVKQRS